MGDAVDILGVERGDGKSTPKTSGRKPKRLSEGTVKRPEGMHRELYALLCSDYRRDPPTLAPTDTGVGYRQPKAKIGRSRVRQWIWTPFTNPARSDDLTLHHWRRKVDEGKEYPFAKFGKARHDVNYTEEEYEVYLLDEVDGWSKEETDYLFELSRDFDQRFVVMTDRWDGERFPNRTMEDLKNRYYHVVQKLITARTPAGQEPQDLPPPYDCEHEKNRKEQLNKLFNRTPEEVEEEEMLVAELKKIEGRKKEREKKSHDINKLITATENKPSSSLNTSSELGALPGSSADLQNIKKDKKSGKKSKKRRPDPPGGEKAKEQQPGIKFPEIKGSGVFLRSSRLKMPPSVGNKKSKAVEQLLDELGVDLFPMPTEEICQNFNELRNQLLLLYELKQAMGNVEYELQTMKHQYELSCPGKKVSDLIGFSLAPPAEPDVVEGTSATSSAVVPSSSATSVAATPDAPSDGTTVSSTGAVGGGLLIDTVATIQPIGSRKRRSTLLDNNPWKKTKKP